jgi:hypothetical protein
MSAADFEITPKTEGGAADVQEVRAAELLHTYVGQPLGADTRFETGWSGLKTSQWWIHWPAV